MKALLLTGASSDVGTSLVDKVISNYDYIYCQYNTGVVGIEEMKWKYEKKIVSLKADFSNMNDIEKMCDVIDDKYFPPSHIVHLSATRPQLKNFNKINLDEYKNGLEVSLLSIVYILQRFLADMKSNHYGKIIFMLTSYTLGNTPKYLSPYITSKYALLGLMKSLIAEYTAYGININAVSPEMMETNFLSNLNDIVIRASAEDSPRNKNVSVEEVVPLIEYLLSENSNAVYGQNIGVTGGKI